MENTNDFNTISEIVDRTVEEMFCEAHAEIETKSGDITPQQAFELDRIKKELATLIYEQVQQNK